MNSIISIDNNKLEVTCKRIDFIDLIKVTSAFLIVLQHSISNSWMEYDSYSIKWMIINALFVLSRVGVPLFFMCSGYGMLRKERTIKSILQSITTLLIVYVSWMTVYGIIDMINLIINGHTVRVVIGGFVKKIIFGNYHTWFIFTLVGLYLLTPIFYYCMNNLKLASYSIILSGIATFIIPLLSKMNGYERFQDTLVSLDITYMSGYLFYYLIGFYIVKYVNVNKKLNYILTVTVFMGINIWSNICSFRANSSIQYMFIDSFVVGGLFCILMFMCFMNNKTSNELQQVCTKW